jgi:GGDEF domain-containing protein
MELLDLDSIYNKLENVICENFNFVKPPTINFNFDLKLDLKLTKLLNYLDIISEEFKVLKIATKLDLIKLTRIFNNSNNLYLPFETILNDFYGNNGIGLLTMINPISNLLNREIGEKILDNLRKKDIEFKTTIIDLMALKSANDFSINGLDSGDKYIAIFAENLQNYLFDLGINFTLIHWGGDEFLILTQQETELDLTMIQKYFLTIDTTSIFDVTNPTFVMEHIKQAEFFGGDLLELKRNIEQEVKYLKSKKYFLALKNSFLNTLHPRNNIHLIISILNMVTIISIIKKTSPYLRKKDLENLYLNSVFFNYCDYKNIIKRILPLPKIRLVGLQINIFPKDFNSTKALISFINNCTELKMENHKIKENLWKNKDLCALMVDPRLQHRKARADD